MRRDELDAGAFAFRFPQGFRRFDAFGLREHIFREDNAVPVLHAPADSKRNAAVFRVVCHLHRGKKAVQVTVKNDAIHGRLLSGKMMN